MLATAISATPGLKVIAWCDEVGIVHDTIADVVWKVEFDECRAPVDQQIAVLQGKRDAVVLEPKTRICGYLSRVRNWNKGKLGELKDRQKGDYHLESCKMEVPLFKQK